MTIYIPYKHNGEDALKYALRGIEKNFPHDVVLITDTPPEWYKGNILYKQDVSSRKQLNLISKLFEIKDEQFIYWNDDHFLIKPITEIKNWYEGTISQALKKAQGRYYQAVGNTYEHFGDVKYYDIHTPCILTREQVHRVFRLEWGDKEFVIKSAALCQEEGEEMKDLKINRPVSMTAIEHLIKDRTFFSTGPNGWKTPMINLLNIMFPHKSKWEKSLTG